MASLRSLPPAVAYTASIIAAKGFSLLTVPLTAVYLSPIEYGNFDLARTIVDFVDLILFLGAAECVTRFATTAQTRCGQDSIAAEFLGSTIAIVAVLGCVFLAAAPVIMEWMHISIAILAVRAAIVAVMFGAVASIPLVWTRFRDRPGRYLLFTCVSSVLLVCATVGALILGYGAEGMLIGNAIVVVLASALQIALQVRETGVRFRWERVVSIVQYGFPLVGAGLAMFLISSANRWFLLDHVTMADIAHFGLANRLAMVTGLFFAPLILWWQPKRIAALATPEGHAQSARAWRLGYLIILVSATAVALGVPLFIKWFLPSGFHKAATYVPGLVLVQFLLATSWMASIGSYARSTGFQVLAIDVLSALFAVAGFALAASRFGIEGIIVVMIAAQALRCSLYLYAGRGTIDLGYPMIRIAALGCSALFFVLMAPPPDLVWQRFACLILCPALVLLLALRLGLTAVPGPVLAWLQRSLAFRA